MSVVFGPVPRALQALGREVTLWLTVVANRRSVAQDDSVASTAAGVRADLNALLAKLRAAGLMQE